VRDGLPAPGAGFEDGLALAAVAGEDLEQPGLREAVGGGDVADGSVLDHHRRDQQSDKCRARTLGLGDRSLRDDSRHHSGMS